MVLLAKKKAVQAEEAEAYEESDFFVDGSPLKVKTESEDRENKFLQVSDRAGNQEGVTVSAKLPGGYYTLEFDIRQSVDVTAFTPTGDVNIGLNFKDSVNYNHSDAHRVTYETKAAGNSILIYDSDAGDNTDGVITKSGAAPIVLFDYNRDGSWKHVTVPLKVNNPELGGALVNGLVYIHGGGNMSYCNPFDIDNIIIRNEAGTVIWQEDFESDSRWSEGTVSAFGSSTAVYDKIDGVKTELGRAKITDKVYIKRANYSIVKQGTVASMTVSDNDTIVYSDDTVLSPGEYAIKGSIRNEYFNNAQDNTYSGGSNTKTSYLVFNGAECTLNGTKYAKNKLFFDNNNFTLTLSSDITEEVKTYTVTSGWTDFELAFTVTEEMTVPKISFTVDHSMPYTIGDSANQVPVDIKDLRLEYVLVPEEEIMLSDNLIANGDLEQSVTVNNTVAAAAQSVSSAGWYAKDDVSSPTALAYVTEADNSFIRVSDIDKAQRGVYYNSGVVLEAGIYKFTVSLRVSETADAANYTAYTWRSSDRSYQSMRATLQNPDNIFSAEYVASQPVDLDTRLDISKSVVGTLMNVTREWTAYTDTIIVTKPTLAVFKIGGGTGGARDSHGFDIDNLSLYKVGEYTSEDEDNLIVNGTFSVKPSIAVTYDADKTDTWFTNAGMDYRYNESGKPATSEPKILHDHQIAYTNGCITVSGRLYNNRPIYYRPSAMLEPGTYRLGIDFKTPVAGESTQMRVRIYDDGNNVLFEPGSKIVADVTNEWSTFTAEFTVTEATRIKIDIYGGPNAAYKQNYSIDNVTLTKVG